MLHHPQLAGVTCKECQAWHIDLKTGKKQTKGGQPIKRFTPPPCYSCPKGREDRPAPEVTELSEKNVAALAYYWQCKADTTGILPRDPIVIRNNSLILRVLDQTDRAAQAMPVEMMLAMLGAKKK